ncbi:MAG: hypothetical protein IIA59_06730 [Candidatus Marinimicrobia bacterium]|nr:hypothetical protein [Candidatus Neomarinimicrobiota bacterium]
MRDVKSLLVAYIALMIGCTGSGRTAHVVFIDYTQSASTFRGDNPSKVKELLRGLVAKMGPEDLLEVYAIHAYTASASPLLRLRGPELKGDLNDEMRKEAWMKNTAMPALQDIWQVDFSEDRTSSTNIYPTVRKISRLRKAGYVVKGYVVADMIQDFQGEDFHNVFSDPGVDPTEHARYKVKEFGFQGVLKGIDVVVKIPGSPQGNQVYDSVRWKVNEFWEAFFTECGAVVVIEDL